MPSNPPSLVGANHSCKILDPPLSDESFGTISQDERVVEEDDLHTSLLNIQNNTSSESNNGSIPVILNQNGPIITSVRTRNPSNLVKPITLSSTVQSQSKSLSFGCVNARSLKNKTEVFSDHVIDYKLDVCAVTETWLKKNDTVTLSALSPSGYIFKNIPRASDRTGGGTGILVRDNYNIHLVQAIERNSFEVSEWNVSTNGNPTPLMPGNLLTFLNLLVLFSTLISLLIPLEIALILLLLDLLMT